jgi:hypothetical protein
MGLQQPAHTQQSHTVNMKTAKSYQNLQLTFYTTEDTVTISSEYGNHPSVIKKKPGETSKQN